MFSPPVYLRNAHLQTVLNSLGPRRLRASRLRPRLGGVETIVEADDGTRLRAELDPAPEGTRTLVVLLHGWEGCSWSSYMIITAYRLNALGCDVLRLNLRDHGDSHHLNRELFNSTRSPEVASAYFALSQALYQKASPPIAGSSSAAAGCSRSARRSTRRGSWTR